MQGSGHVASFPGTRHCGVTATCVGRSSGIQYHAGVQWKSLPEDASINLHSFVMATSGNHAVLMYRLAMGRGASGGTKPPK
jgi:hypothetical protein